MNMTNLIFGIVGGLGLFFFGMQTMSEGLKNIAGNRLKKILHMATKIPIVAIFVGAAVTCFIQSSSATTVMVVGFVNAGLLSLKQAISVIVGANIGTTFTAWLVSSMSVFKVTQYALPAVGFGFLMMNFGKTRKSRFWGQVLMGFGFLFLGLSFLQDSFEPMKNSQHVKDVFIAFSDNPILGVLVGIIFTVLLQSSSATIAIVQVLAFNGLISFPAAIPIILGDNIGTTITAQMAAFGTNLNARRAAMAHTLFNVIGVGYMLFFVYTGWFVKGINLIMPGPVTPKNIMFYIAVSHSAFNVINTIVFLPFLGLLEKASILLVPKKKGMVEMGTKYLEKHLLATPSIALEQARKETVRMLEMASSAVRSAVKGFFDNDKKTLRPIGNLEQAVDNLQTEITQYLVDLSQKQLLPEEAEELPVLIHSVNDIERIGDHSENIKELAERKIDEKLPLTDEAVDGLRAMWKEVDLMVADVKVALDHEDREVARRVLQREDKINNFQEKLKQDHVDRLNKGECDISAGIVYIDLVDNLEKIADHLTNVAQGVLDGLRWKGVDEKVALV